MGPYGRTWVWILGGLALILFSLVVMGWFLLPKWITSENLRGELSQKIKASSGLETQIETLKITGFSPLRVVGKGVTLRGEKGEEIAFFPEAVAVFSIFHLLRGEIHIKSLELDGAILRGDLLSLGEIQGQGLSGLPLGVPSLRVRDGTLFLGNVGQEKISIRDWELMTTSLGSAALGFRAKGLVYLGESPEFSFGALGSRDQDGKTRVVVDAESISLERIFQLIRGGASPPSVSGKMEFHLEANGSSFSQMSWKLRGRIDELEVNWPGILEVPFKSHLSMINARGSRIQEFWTVEEARWKDDKFEVKANLKLGQGKIEGTVQGSPFQLHDVIQYLGKELIGPALQGFFREDVLGGIARGVSFTFSGTMEESDKTLVVMEMPFERASLRFDPNLPPLEELSGILVWQKDKVWFKDLKGKYKNQTFERMEAKITEIGKSSILEGLFAVELSWSDMNELLRAVQGSSSKTEFLGSVEGECGLQLALRKAFLKKEPLYYDATIQVKEAKGKPLLGKFEWRAQSGIVRANPHDIFLEEIRGTIGSSRWELRAEVKNWSAGGISARGNASVSASVKDLGDLLGEALENLRVEGNSPVSLELSVHANEREIRGSMEADLSTERIAYGRIWEKEAGDDFRLVLFLVGLPGGELRLEGAKVMDEGAEVLAWRKEGRWLIEAKEFPATLLGKRIKLLGKVLKKGTLGIRAWFDSQEPSNSDLTASPQGVGILLPSIEKELLVRSGSLFLSQNGLTAEGVEMEMDGTLVIFTGNIEFASEGKIRVKGGMRGEHLKLDGLLKPSGKIRHSTSDTQLQRLLDKAKDFQLSLAFRKASFKEFSFDNLQATLEKGDGDLILKDLVGHIFQGEIRMQGRMISLDQWEIGGKLEGAKASEFLSAVGMSDTLIEGNMGVHGKVTRAEEEGSALLRTKGEFSLEIQKGLIRKFPILASILSIMNLSQLFSGKVPQFSQEGMVFETITGTFHLEEGKLHTEDLTVKSEAMVLTMEGEIDLGKRQCDLKVGVRPFVGFDRFVTKIPVIRHYLAGRERTVFAAYFLVKGDLSSPEVTPIPLESLGNAFVGLFKRLFQNPFWDMGPPAEKVEPPLEVEHAR